MSFTFHAQSRDHLDALYKDLEACDQVLWLL
jgi:putative lipoic acid-binding regulatory protein